MSYKLASSEFVKDQTNLLRLEMKQAKSAIIKWMFIFWISSTAITICSLFTLVKFLVK